MKKNLRIWSLLLAVLMVAAMFAGCAPSEEGGDEGGDTPATGGDVKSGPAIDRDTVVIATADETPSLGTASHNAVAGDYLNKLTHNGLFRLDKELNPTPDLVDTYSYDEATSVWTFTLKDGIKFHDGSDLTSEDVIATLNWAKGMSDIATYTKAYDNLTEVDELTFTLTTDGPSASLLYDLSHHGTYINPKELIDQGGTVVSDEPIGAGPYKIVEWTRGTKITLTAHEDYFDTDRAPAIKNIEWRIIPEASARTISMQAGEIDYIIELDSTAVTTLEEDANLEVIQQPSVSHNWLTINNEVAPFDDVNVRRAINHAINRADVITVALNGFGVPATAQTPEGMLGWTPENFGGEYDLEKAQEYMDAWGGDPSTIELEIICSNETKVRASSVVIENLKAIGINAEIVNMDLATYLTVTAEGDFTGFIGGYTSNEMMSFLNGVFHSASINSSNKTRTANAELDALIDEARVTVDQDAREQVLMGATKILNDGAYQMPLYQDTTLSAHKVNLQNTGITPGGTFFVQEWTWAE